MQSVLIFSLPKWHDLSLGFLVRFILLKFFPIVCLPTHLIHGVSNQGCLCFSSSNFPFPFGFSWKTGCLCGVQNTTCCHPVDTIFAVLGFTILTLSTKCKGILKVSTVISLHYFSFLLFWLSKIILKLYFRSVLSWCSIWGDRLASRRDTRETWCHHVCERTGAQRNQVH